MRFTQKSKFMFVIIIALTTFGFIHAQVEANAIFLKRGILWETVNVAKMGPVFQSWDHKGYGMDYPGFDPEFIPQQVGGANSHHAGGGFWMSALRPSAGDTVWAVQDWAMFATSVGLSATNSPYLLKTHRLRWSNGENYGMQTDPNEAEEVVDTEWEFNPEYRFPYTPARFLPVRVKRTVRVWSGSAIDEKYVIIEYVITNISREPHIFNRQKANPDAYRILKADSVLQDVYLLFTYAFSINNRGWSVLFPQLGNGAQNNRFLYDPMRRMVYGWADDYTVAEGNQKFDPYVYESGGPPSGKEWLAPAFAGIKFLHISKNDYGRENFINPTSVGWSVSEPANSYPFTGLETPEQEYEAMKDLSKTYNPILFPQGLSDGRWGRSRLWTMVSLGPWTLMPGDSIKIVMAEVVGSVDLSRITDPDLSEQEIAQEGLLDLQRTADRAQFNYDHGYNVPDPPQPPSSFQLTRLHEQTVGNVLTWSNEAESIPDPDYTGDEQFDLAGYRIYRSDYMPFGPWKLLAEIPKGDPDYFNSQTQTYQYIDTLVNVGFSYYYAITSYDTGHAEWSIDPSARFKETGSNRVPPLESSKYPNHTTEPFAAAFAPENETLNKILVVPNPFVIRSGFTTPGGRDLISFVNIPSPCTIRIYTVRGDLIKTIEHTADTGIAQWDQITDYGQYAESGVYIFQVASHAGATKNKTYTGKFSIVR
ncbi:MAG: T9SS type A sorting domain-containing protein [Calditrichaeota bacterium]|nr:T9SS type A sorting domain-containing protein [Calditrichota bacterium]